MKLEKHKIIIIYIYIYNVAEGIEDRSSYNWSTKSISAFSSALRFTLWRPRYDVTEASINPVKTKLPQPPQFHYNSNIATSLKNPNGETTICWYLTGSTLYVSIQQSETIQFSKRLKVGYMHNIYPTNHGHPSLRTSRTPKKTSLSNYSNHFIQFKTIITVEGKKKIGSFMLLIWK